MAFVNITFLKKIKLEWASWTEFRSILSLKRVQKGFQIGTQMEPKSDPRRTKIEDKNEVEKRSSRRSSWSRLGSILGRLGCRLGVKIVLSPKVALVFLKIDFLKKMRVQEATWVDLGSIWVAQGGSR